jgi:hypothetical protein
VNGGAVVLLERLAFRCCGARQGHRQREPLLPGGASRCERRPEGAAGTSRRWLLRRRST